jgi:hypothetical protein
MAADGYVTIHRTTDAAQGELLAETLRSEGIDARFHRVSSTLIGIPTLMIEMTVDVPAKSEARALEVLRDLEYVGADGAAPADAEAGDDAGEQGGHPEKEEEEKEEEGEAPGPPSRMRVLARAGFTLFLPGTFHLYAGRPWSALVLGAGACACVGVMIAAPGAASFGVALGAILGIVVCDMVGGLRAVHADSVGQKAGRRRQITRGLLLLAVAGAFGAAARTAAAAPQWWREHLLSRFSVTCTRTSLMVESRDGDDRNVEIRWAGIRTPGTEGDEVTYEVPFAANPSFRLRPSTTQRVALTPHMALVASCKAGRACRMVFAATFEAADGQGPRPLHAAGECTPDWGEQSAAVPARLTLAESDGE